jgi:hypothetical protein
VSTSYISEQTLRSLTERGIDYYKALNERDQNALASLRDQRAVYEAEIASVDDVMRDLEETIARRQAKMRGDVIGLLPAAGEPPIGEGEPAPESEGSPFDRDELSSVGGHS